MKIQRIQKILDAHRKSCYCQNIIHVNIIQTAIDFNAVVKIDEDIKVGVGIKIRVSWKTPEFFQRQIHLLLVEIYKWKPITY